ncbi:MAG: rod shape-determining protein MreD [Pseudomonadota bacterium]|jgi:rod shape-determining protein MreD
MRFLYLPLLFAVILILQSTTVTFLFPDWMVGGFDLPLIVVIHVALTRGKTAGMLSGLILGYFQDAMSGGILGFNGVSKVLGGFTGGYLKEKFFMRSVAHRLASVAGAVLMALLTKAAVLSLFSQPHPPVISSPFLWGFTGNTFFALVIHALLERFETMLGIRTEEELSLGD